MKLLLSLIFLVLFCMDTKSQQVNKDSIQHQLSGAASDSETMNIYLLGAQRAMESDPLLSFEYAQSAFQIAQRLKNDSLVAEANRYQANALIHLGNYSQALEIYLVLLKYGESKGDSALLMSAYGNVGNVYYHQNDYDDALKNYFLALKYFPARRGDNTLLVRKANLLNNIGTIYDQTKNYDEAEAYYREALALGKAINNAVVIGNVLNNTGTLYRDRGEHELAIKYYKDAYFIRTQHNNLLGMARSCYSIGLYYYQHRSLDSASLYLKKSIDIGQENGLLETVSSAAEIYYNVNKDLGNDKQALQALELFTQVKDSLFNEQNTKRIAQLEMQFQFDKKQLELETEQNEKEFRYVMGGSVLILLLLIATVLWLLQKNKTRKGQLNAAKLQLEKVQLTADLEKKDKELATNITFLLSKNELINSVSEKLLEIKQAAPVESQAALQKVILDIQSNLQPELWQEFEFRFQQAHENFYKALTIKFPDLTPSERRLCAFLKLNMTTKEISALTHQNAKSIDVARTRLRKKLGLTGIDQNLVTFLEQLDVDNPAS